MALIPKSWPLPCIVWVDSVTLILTASLESDPLSFLCQMLVFFFLRFILAILCSICEIYFYRWILLQYICIMHLHKKKTRQRYIQYSTYILSLACTFLLKNIIFIIIIDINYFDCYCSHYLIFWCCCFHIMKLQTKIESVCVWCPIKT